MNLNQNKFVRVFEALIVAGVSTTEATKMAANAAKDPVVTSREFTKGELTVESNTTLRQRIIAYGEKHNGREFSLQALAASLGVATNKVSSMISLILASSTKLQRTGFGLYVYRKNG